MLRIRVRANESVEQMVKRFKKLCEKEGLTRDIKRNAYYEKPSERRRRKVRKSLKRIASSASYNSVRKDSADFALIRLLVDQTQRVVEELPVRTQAVLEVLAAEGVGEEHDPTLPGHRRMRGVLQAEGRVLV